MHRLRATITVEYDAEDRYYLSSDPQYKAEIDQSNLSNLENLVEFIIERDFTIKVEPV